MKKKMSQLYGIGVGTMLIISLVACGTAPQTPDELESFAGSVEVEMVDLFSLEEDKPDFRVKEMKDGNSVENTGRGNNVGGMESQNDSAIQTILDENADKFTQFTFTDAEAGINLEYSLYVPEDYDDSEQYPLLMYIPDSTGARKNAKELVEQYYGATVWVTDEEQQKHPSFVMVPAFSETVVDDDWKVSEQVEIAVHIINELQSLYNINSNRIYTTGQSMGCMASLYLNSIYPDLFAASMYISGQWDITTLKEMENQKFFYITAGGDAKASGGQDEVMTMFDKDGITYSFGTWNAQNNEEEQILAVEQLLSLGVDANMIRFETGSVLKDGTNGMEHMASFNYGYKLSAVRDWLFEQSNESTGSVRTQ